MRFGCFSTAKVPNSNSFFFGGGGGDTRYRNVRVPGLNCIMNEFQVYVLLQTRLVKLQNSGMYCQNHFGDFFCTLHQER
jgi:hypothetical protein